MQPERTPAHGRANRRDEEICVVDGYASRITVQQRHLLVADGTGRSRRQRRYARATCRLKRLVVVGHSGIVSLEALRWLADTNTTFIQIDRDGRVLATSTPNEGDARIRRAQALALFNDTGVEIARQLLAAKLAGQKRTLHKLPAADAQAQIDRASAAVAIGTTLDELVIAERDAALAYWSAWATLPMRFAAEDRRRVPDHWLSFGQRGSPLTSAPRLAINPINATLNYLYAILEAKTRIACLTVGLDPTLGIVHADYGNRNSLALDLMEPVRPKVDAYTLKLICTRTFRASDFYETGRGNCRLSGRIAALLAQTAAAWAALVAPVAEDVVRTLATAPGARINRLTTPLTNAKRHAAKQRDRTPQRSGRSATPRVEPSCHRCGGDLPSAGRKYCDGCLAHRNGEQFERFFAGTGLAAIEAAKADGRDPTHGGKAAKRRARTNVARKEAVAEWEAQYGKVVDLTTFSRDILPTIREVPLSRLVRATGLSVRYCSQVRRGERVPHPRHWEAFRSAPQTVHPGQ